MDLFVIPLDGFDMVLDM
jgi:hypothetical protein